MNEPTLPDDLVQGLRSRLLVRATATAAAIDQFLITPDPALAEIIRGSAHKIAGIAATIGLSELGKAAGAVDAAALPVPPGERAIEDLMGLRHAIRAAGSEA